MNPPGPDADLELLEIVGVEGPKRQICNPAVALEIERISSVSKTGSNGFLNANYVALTTFS